jgi:AraC-like DNA-binding protein
MHYAFSRLSSLDVKWAGVYHVTPSFAQYDRYNPHYELIAVTEGPVHFQSEQEKVVLHTGETFLLAPWERHKGWEQERQGGEFYWVQFTSSREMKRIEPHAEPSTDLKIVQHGQSELRTIREEQDELLLLPRRSRSANRFQLLSLFSRLISENNESKGYFRYRLSLLLGGMLELLATDSLSQARQDTALPASFVTYRALVSFMDNSYQRSLTGSHFEQALDRKYEYLCQVFKKYSGMTIVAYLQQLRIQRAKHLLISTDKSVRDISEEVGLDDPFYFSKLFKKTELVSPTDFRARNKQS